MVVAGLLKQLFGRNLVVERSSQGTCSLDQYYTPKIRTDMHKVPAVERGIIASNYSKTAF
jgi:hypothetical protein